MTNFDHGLILGLSMPWFGSAVDKGTIEKVILYAYWGDEVNSEGACVLSRHKITSGLSVSLSNGTASTRHTLYLELLAITSNGGIVHLRDIDPNFSVVWNHDVVIRLWGSFYVMNAPDYANRILLHYGGDWGDTTGENTPVPAIPSNVDAICYDFRVAPASVMSDSFSIQALSVVLNGNSYTPEVYFYDDMRNQIATYDSASDTLYFDRDCKLPVLNNRYGDPIRNRFDSDSGSDHYFYYSKMVIYADKTNVIIASEYFDRLYTESVAVLELHNIANIPEYFMKTADDTGLGKYAVYFMNSKYEYVSVANNPLFDPDLLFVDTSDNFEYTYEVYTDNICIYKGLMQSYGHLDSNLFAVYHLDGSAW